MAEESHYESTPLLLDSLSPPPTTTISSAFSSSSSRHYLGRRRRRHLNRSSSQVHPLHHSKQQPTVISRYATTTSSSSSRHFSSSTASTVSSRKLTSASPSSALAAATTTTTTSPQTILPIIPNTNKLWQTIISIPHHILCFTSQTCSPFCGLCCCITCIRTSEYGIVQTFGKYERILQPGMHILKWPMEREAGRISMRIRQLDVTCETKSKDHVFLRVHVSIQYQVNSTHLYESFYSLSSPIRQLTTHIHDIIRSTLPQLDLDDIFSSQDSIAFELHRSLNGSMNQYGYMIHHSLITKINPNDHVKASMNEMEASKREREAMPQKAEAVRIKLVKDAEGRAERAYLNGLGVARERKAIAMGMKDVAHSVVSQGGGVDSDIDDQQVVNTKSVMDLLLLTQYMDVLTELNGRRRRGTEGEDEDEEKEGSSLFLTHMPETVSQLSATVRECFADCDTVKVDNLLDL